MPQHYADTQSSTEWVVPFGNLGIKGYLHLNRAYRSLSRPSSPPRAKASTGRPSLLFFLLWTILPALLYSTLLLLSNNFCEIVYLFFLTRKKFTLFVHHVKERTYSQRSNWVKGTDSNRFVWTAARGFVIDRHGVGAWRAGLGVPFPTFDVVSVGSPRQSWTADLYIISVAL